MLEPLRARDAVVLAIPRGGVPIGHVIATHFRWPLGILLTKKIGHPHDPEYAIGAVGLDAAVIDPGHDDVPRAYIDRETDRIRDILRQRQARFAAACPQPQITGKTVIIVDDGIATGYTMLASIAIVRMLHPASVIVATPVAAPSVLHAMQREADAFIVLDTPDDFSGVGQFYTDFAQVSDDEVVDYLEAHR